MANWLRHHIWQLGLGVLLLAGIVVGFLVIRNAPLEANPGMPEDQRAFWRWVGTINQGADHTGIRMDPPCDFNLLPVVKARDDIDRQKLLQLGWNSFVIWECELADLEEVSRKVREFLDPAESD